MTIFWKFLRTNWFPIALVVLVLFALARKNWRLPFLGGPPRQEQYTGRADTASETSQMGLWSEGNDRLDMPSIGNAASAAFLKRFGQVAHAEQQKFKIPASVLLGTAYINSFAGQRESARTANNYFALACSPDWDGETQTLGGRCFKRYPTAWEGFRDFSLYLSDQRWVLEAKQKAALDWRAWASLMAEHRMSDVRQYEAELVKVIEAYQLYELDRKNGF